MKPRPLAIAVASLLAILAAAAASAATRTSPSGVHVVLTHTGPHISGPTNWRAGAIRIDAISQAPDQEVTLLHFRRGYTYANFLADGKKAQAHGSTARAAIDRVFAHTIFDGGLDLFTGQAATFTALVSPGTYYLGEMTTRPQLTAIHVTGAPASDRLRSAATVTATNHSFRVGGRLPAHGTITFVDASSRPHRLNLIPVEASTTHAEVIAYLRRTGGRDNTPPPPFALETPQLGTAEVSPRRRMQLTYDLPAGTYIAVDFDHDMSTGRPEALEGLARIVTLR